MSLNFSAAHSSRINKRPRDRNPLLKRSSSLLLNQIPRRKPVSRSQSKPEKLIDEEDFFEDRLHDRGLVISLATDLTLRDIPQNIRYVHSHMFDPIPEKGGMNSTKIAEALNFRRSLPPTVTVAHIHALISSPTVVEREIAELSKAGILRKITIPGRGTGLSSVSDGLILMQDLERLLKEANGLDQQLRTRFWQYLTENPNSPIIPARLFPDADFAALMRAGFLTANSSSLNTANVFTHPNTADSTKTTSLSNISRAASGSVAAVGGEGAIHGAGNTGKDSVICRNSSQLESNGSVLQLALPNTGPYLKFLTAARNHLMALLMKTKYRELPIAFLHERWDGGIAGDNAAAKAKKYRGDFTGVLPGRTRKWKQFHGLSFEWVLAECLGAGLIEVFETGSVGRAVRAP